MPGVPPDALAQVKKGLRGLFTRKKSKGAASQQQSSEPESTSRELPTDTGAAAPATSARAGDDTNNGPPAIEAPTTSSPNPAHHISEPSGVEEAKAVDLNPTTTTTNVTEAAKVDEGKLAPLTTSGIKGESSTGMSATSGPLGDHMAEVYQEVGHEHVHDPAEEDIGAGGKD